LGHDPKRRDDEEVWCGNARRRELLEQLDDKIALGWAPFRIGFAIDIEPYGGPKNVSYLPRTISS
jgi:hypothetical protein